ATQQGQGGATLRHDETLSGAAASGAGAPRLRLKNRAPAPIFGSQIALPRGTVSTAAPVEAPVEIRTCSMPLASLFRRNRHRDAALSLYSAIVAQARAP